MTPKIGNDPTGKGATSANNVGANSTMNDVVGNKEDSNLAGPGLDSLYGIAGYMAYYHVHSPAYPYPNLADPINIISGSGAWNYGAYTELIPADTIEEAFDIHWIHTAEISAQDNYQIELYSGAPGAEIPIGAIAFSRDSNQVQTASQPIQIPPQLKDTRISARLASGTGSDNCDIKLYLHEYPS